MEVITLDKEKVEDIILHFELDITQENHFNSRYTKERYHKGFLNCLCQLDLIEYNDSKLLDLINKQKK